MNEQTSDLIKDLARSWGHTIPTGDILNTIDAWTILYSLDYHQDLSLELRPLGLEEAAKKALDLTPIPNRVITLLELEEGQLNCLYFVFFELYERGLIESPFELYENTLTDAWNCASHLTGDEPVDLSVEALIETLESI